MAHNISNIDKQQGTEMGWHGKTEIKNVITLADNWLREWDVIAEKLYRKNGDETRFSQLVCSDDNKITVGQAFDAQTYFPITNLDFLKLVEDSISGTDHQIVSVGSVCERQRVFVSVKLAGLEDFKSAGRDFKPFLNFGNGHGKSAPLFVNTSNVCTVCDNRFTWNMVEVLTNLHKDDGQVRHAAKHTKNVQLRLPEIAKLIDKAVGIQAQFAIELEKMALIPCNTNQAESFFAGFIAPDNTEKLSTRSQNIVGEMVDLYKNGRGNDGNGLDDVFQAGTDYYSHKSSGGKDKFKQFVSSEFGAGKNRKTELFSILRNENKRNEVIKRGEALLLAS